MNFNRICWLIPLLLLGCDTFEYSPNQSFARDTPQNLNAKNLARLYARPVDDTVTIAFVGDSQRFYDEVESFVSKVNSIPTVDFVLLAGDITDFGLLKEYEWIHKDFSRINAPYIAVIGNHDVISQGEDVFRRMYGPLNFSFVYDSIQFVIHNTNSREYTVPVPDMPWLENELNGEASANARYIVPVSHVPPGHGDFSPDLTMPYTKLLSSTPRVIASLHGHVHEHTDGHPFNDGIRYITSFSFDQDSFLLLRIVDGKISKETVLY
jgi:3',5'-cyclic-AMP phosphodiesterase